MTPAEERKLFRAAYEVLRGYTSSQLAKWVEVSAQTMSYILGTGRRSQGVRPGQQRFYLVADLCDQYAESLQHMADALRIEAERVRPIGRRGGVISYRIKPTLEEAE